MINVKETFLKLTTRKYPHGTEGLVIGLLPEFNFTKDSFGNYFIIIKKSDDTFSENMFTCHLDTVSHAYEYSLSIKHVIKDDFIKTDGYSNLGADDKAGMVIMLNMITENIPGLYYFFIGEEVGRIGSSNLAFAYPTLVKEQKLPTIKRCISFDRKGYDLVTTEQMNNVCCSKEFATDLSNKLNEYGFWYKPDDKGGRTDSHQFIDLVPECTNISVGYFNEHTSLEMQDIEFLELLSLAVLKIEWDSLPIKRKIDVNKTVIMTPHKHKGAIIPVNNSTTNTIYNSTSRYNSTTSSDLSTDAEFDAWYNEQKVKNIVFG